MAEFRMFGPVELWAHGVRIPFPAPKVKHLYAALLWNAGTSVPIRTLIHRVWGDDPPPKELVSLQSNASRLRNVLSECGDPSVELTWDSTGYRLLVPADCIDRNQFERAVSLAGSAAERGDTHEAIRLLTTAAALVRGAEPLIGLPGSWAAETRAILEERIRDAAIQRITLQSKLSDGHAVLPELYQLSVKHLFDETILELLMRTLRAVGRTTDALDAFAIFQRRLREEKGLDAPASLKRLQQEYLSDSSTPSPLAQTNIPTPTRPLPPDTLDREVPNFVGRDQDIETISAEIDRQLAAGASVVFAIDGAPGVGKTALGLKIAYRVRHRCPDGAMHLHLRGHDEHQQPTDPATALRLLLEMLGAEANQIQHAVGVDGAIALWRKHTAGRRLLLLLDDAADAEQVAPLIPSGAGNIVLITTRTRMTGLPEATPHPLALMSDDEADRLFTSSARISPTTRDPALREVVDFCGGFPLALAVVGNVFRTRPAWSISDLAEHLANARTSMHRPDALLKPIFRAIASSYRTLPQFERTLLRRLALNPGLRTHLPVAAALIGAEPRETDAALFNLVEQNLVSEPERHQYQLHDMMKLFVSQACEAEDTEEDLAAAETRLMYYTVGAVEEATTLFDQRHDSPAGIGRPDAKQATKWLESEQRWLQTIIEYWFDKGHAQEAATLVGLLSRFLDRKNLWAASIALHQRSLSVWQECANRAAEARTITALATAHWRLGQLEEALSHATRALDIWSALGDPDGSADALLQLGRAHLAQHSNAAATECFSRCAAHWQEVGDPQQAAMALHHLSAAQFDMGRLQEAIATLEAGLELAEQSNDLIVRCNCLNSLGVFLVRLGDHARAEHYYRRALILAGEIGDPNRIAALTMNLGICQTHLGRPEGALPLLERAHETFASLRDHYFLARTLEAQAEAHLELGRHWDAQAFLDSATVTAEQTGDRIQLARIHLAYARMYVAAADLPAALRALHLALDFAHQAGVASMLSLVHRSLGDVHESMGQATEAHKWWQLALEGIHGMPSPEVEALRKKLVHGPVAEAA